MCAEGSQLVATHSPVLVTLPAATSPGEWGIRRVDHFDDIDLVANWRSYLEAPERYLRHLRHLRHLRDLRDLRASCAPPAHRLTPPVRRKTRPQDACLTATGRA